MNLQGGVAGFCDELEAFEILINDAAHTVFFAMNLHEDNYEFVEKLVEWAAGVFLEDASEEDGVLLHVLQREGGEDGVLIGEIFVERADADAGFVSDVVGGDFVERVVIQKASSGFEDLMASADGARLLRRFARLQVLFHAGKGLVESEQKRRVIARYFS